MSRLGFLVLIAVLLAAPAALSMTADEAKYALLYEGEGVYFLPGELVVGYEPTLSEYQAYDLVREMDSGVLHCEPSAAILRIALPPHMPVRAAAEMFEDLPGVRYAHPNYIKRLHWEPNDYFWTQHHLWNFQVINMPQAWGVDTTAPLYGGDPSIVVAVIDTGVAYLDYVDTLHYGDPPGSDTVTFAKAPDFQNTHFTDGWNFVDEIPQAVDDNNHGTHVSMTIAESTNNDPSGSQTDYSGAGMAFNTTIMPLKVIKLDEGANIYNVALAIRWAADHGAHVANMSLGGPGADVEIEACQYAHDLGVLLVSSTGNDAEESTWNCDEEGVGMPAAYPTVMGAGASQNFRVGDPTYNYELRATYSQWGYGSEILGPAGNYLTGDLDNSGRSDETWQQTIRVRQYPDMTQFSFQSFQGTSMASPHIAAAAALVLAHYQDLGQSLSPDEVRNILNYSAHDLYTQDGLFGYDYESGFGRLDMYAALTETPEPMLVYKKTTVEEGTGNGNMRLEAGETGELVVGVFSLFADAQNVQATLSTSDPYVTVTNGSTSYGNLAFNVLGTNTADPFIVQVAGNCPINHMAEFDLQLSGTGITPVTRTFSTKMYYPSILFVDDDQGKGKYNYDEYYTGAMDEAGIAYHLFRVHQSIECYNDGDNIIYPFEDFTQEIWPDLAMLNRFDAVIWSLGYTQQNRETLTYIEDTLADYLDGGGNLLFSSHEYLYKMYHPETGDDITVLEPGSFPYDYLHIDMVEHDEWYITATGVAGDPISNGMNLTMNDIYSSFSLPVDFRWWPDEVNPRADAVAVL
ncbi:S8 family serine peptidase, partial [bacterium]|nr:S8 family serine peptidase [candidate division CSSED10-310 bacterium]